MKFHFNPIRSVKRKRKVNTVRIPVTHNEGKDKVDHRAGHEGPEWE